MHPARPGRAGDMRILDVLENPTGSKFDWGMAHRMVISHEKERGLVSTARPDGLFCANTGGTFGGVSAGGLEPASERGAPPGSKISRNEDISLLIPGGTVALAQSEISDESFLVANTFSVILGYPLREKISG